MFPDHARRAFKAQGRVVAAIDFYMQGRAGVSEAELVGEGIDPGLAVNQESFFEEVAEGDAGLEGMAEVFIEVGSDLDLVEYPDSRAELQRKRPVPFLPLLALEHHRVAGFEVEAPDFVLESCRKAQFEQAFPGTVFYLVGSQVGDAYACRKSGQEVSGIAEAALLLVQYRITFVLVMQSPGILAVQKAGIQIIYRILLDESHPGEASGKEERGLRLRIEHRQGGISGGRQPTRLFARISRLQAERQAQPLLRLQPSGIQQTGAKKPSCNPFRPANPASPLFSAVREIPPVRQA